MVNKRGHSVHLNMFKIHGNVEKYLKTRGRSLSKRASSGFKDNYRPEIDVTPELEPADTGHYQSLIGLLS